LKIHFTQSALLKIKPKVKPYWINDDESNLRLYVGAGGSMVWYYDYRDVSGRRASRKIGPANALTVAQAREMTSEAAVKVAKGESVKKEKPAEALTLGEFFESHYFPFVKTTLKSHRETIRALTVAFGQFFDKPVEDVNALAVNKWRMAKRDAGNKAASVNRVVASLKSAFSWGLKNGLLETNPLALVTPLKERDSKTIARFLSEDEYNRLEAALIAREEKMRRGRNSGNQWCDERKYHQKPKITGEFADFLRPAVLLSLNTGIRRGALFALKWGDVDLDQQTITLRGDDAKSGKTTRLPLSDDAVDVLTSWKAQSKETGPDSLIFPSPKTGEVIGEPRRSWESVLRAAGIENFRWHDLRHTFASWLVMRGIDLNTVRELMGHADMKMTMRYAHLAPESKLNAVQVLNRRTKGDKIIGRIRKAQND
jgi:integrase